MTVPQSPVDQNKALADLTTYTGWADQTITGLANNLDSVMQQNTSLIARNDELAAENGELSAQVATLSAANSELSAANVQLAADLAACRAGGVKVTTFGTSKPEQTSGIVLPVTGVRTYYQPGEKPTTLTGTALTAFQQAADGGVVWFSIKELADTWLDQLLTDMETRFPKVRILATADHEPKDGWWDSGKIAQWQVRQAAFEDVLADHPKVAGWTIVEGSSIGTSGYWEAVLRERQGFGMDSYNAGIGKPKTYKPPADIHGPRIAWVKSAGKTSVAFGETGTGVTVSDTSRSGQTQWVADNRDFMLVADLPVDTSLWWNSGSDGPQGTGCRLTKAQMDVWLGR